MCLDRCVRVCACGYICIMYYNILSVIWLCTYVRMCMYACNVCLYLLYVCMWVLLHATYCASVQHVPKVPFWSQVSVHTSSVQVWCQVGAYCFLFLVTRSSVSFPCHFVISVSPLLLCSHCHSLVTLLSVSVSVPCHSVVSVSALPLCP